MNADQQSQFIARRFEEHKKATQRALHCHICAENAQFRGEREFLHHLQQTHPESAIDAPNGPTWKDALQQAATKARQRDFRKLAIEPPSISKKSSTDSMKLNYGDAQSTSAASRPVSANLSKASDPKLDEFKRLSLDQNSSPGLIPRKRSAGRQSGSDSRTRGETHTTPKTRRIRRLSAENDADFDRGNLHSSKKLYDPNTDQASFGRSGAASGSRAQESRPHSNRPAYREHQHPRHSNPHHGPSISERHARSPRLMPVPTHMTEPPPQDDWAEEEPELLLQPQTRTVTHEALVQEVESIYADLLLIEAKCIEMHEKLALPQPGEEPRPSLTAGQWSALIALHKTLLHEHHDFFLASQHPAAAASLTELARERNMPARLWKHAIHSFLELLRMNLPSSYDFMLTFLSISYSTVALLYETVPTFSDTWMECLGDLGRYRLFVAENDQRERDVWAGVARLWYGRAGDRRPNAGIFVHHFGVLAKPHSIAQMSYYCRALSAIEPYEQARSSLATVLNPVASERLSKTIRLGTFETSLMKCIHEFATGAECLEFAQCCEQITTGGSLARYCDRLGSKLKEFGVSIGISVLSCLLELRSRVSGPIDFSLIRRSLDEKYEALQPKMRESSTISSQIPSQTTSPPSESDRQASVVSITRASKLAFGVLGVILERLQDRNIFPMIHAYVAFLKTVAPYQDIMELIEMDIPWEALVKYLNHYTRPGSMIATCSLPDFPKDKDNLIGRPLPEDFIMRGSILYFDYFPPTWFTDADVDDEERLLELPSMAAPRLTRILWNGFRIASQGRWISFDQSTCRFSVTEYAKILRPRTLPAMIDSRPLSQHQPETDSIYPTMQDITMTSPEKSPQRLAVADSISVEPAPSNSAFTPKILKREHKINTIPPASPMKAAPVTGTNTTDMQDLLKGDTT